MEETPESPTLRGESERIKAEIARFLREERLAPKLNKINEGEDELRRKLVAEHQPATWIADAARRVRQIQQVTHVVKFTHPSANSSSLSSQGNPAVAGSAIGSHTLGAQSTPDVVGNAAALDVYGFLRLTVDGRTLLDRALARDPALVDALSNDHATATDWLAAFSGLQAAESDLASHKLAKQVYWPIRDGVYHLLAPLFASSLAHTVHKRINDDRFSEASKAARAARRANQAHPHGYRDYPDMVIQSFGGSKPQNISQLNSERHGENYLLPSVPPIWESPVIRPPLAVETVFSRYLERRKEVRRLAVALRDYLKSVSKAATNVRIRQTRSALVADLCGEVIQMAAEVRHHLEPGWTADDACRLNIAEQCWLDPRRRFDDDDFGIHYRLGDWKDDVCLRFANWLNGRLQTDLLHFGEAEALAWQTELGRELGLLREELTDE